MSSSNRLSQNPKNNVLLIEAGNQIIIFDTNTCWLSLYHWCYKTEPDVKMAEFSIMLEAR